MTALYLAAVRGFVIMIEALVAHNADVNAVTNVSRLTSLCASLCA